MVWSFLELGLEESETEAQVRNGRTYVWLVRPKISGTRITEFS